MLVNIAPPPPPPTNPHSRQSTWKLKLTVITYTKAPDPNDSENRQHVQDPVGSPPSVLLTVTCNLIRLYESLKTAVGRDFYFGYTK